MKRVDGQKGRTEEHCFPKWLAPHILGGGDEWEHTVAATATGETKRRYTKGELAVVSKKVCRTCNVGWMEQLERKVRPFLPALIRGEAGELNVAGQRLMAAWATKTALCLELATPADEPIPVEHYRAMAQLKDVPPPRTQVALGMYLGHRLLFHMPKRVPMPQGAHGSQSTFIVGRVVFVVMGHNHSDGIVFKSSGGPDVMPQIWPSFGPLTWPLTGAMDDQGLAVYAGVVL